MNVPRFIISCACLGFVMAVPVRLDSGTPLTFQINGKRPAADERYLINKAGDIESMTSADLKQAKTLVEGLAQVRGIDVQNVGIAGKEQLVVHGYSDKSGILVVYDGVKQNDQNNDGVLWQSIPLAGIEQVDVLRGGHSVIYGGGAVGGVLVVKSPRISDGLHGQTQSNVDQFGKWRGSIRVADRLESGLALSLVQSQVKGRGFRDNSEESSHVTQLKVDQGVLGYSFRYADSQSQIPGELTLADALINPQKSNKTSDKVYKEVLSEHRGRFESESIKGQVYYQERSQKSKLFTDAFANMVRKGSNLNWNGSSELWGLHQWIIGAEGDIADVASGYAASPTGSLSAKTLAGFASDQWRWGDSLMLDLGCRWDRVDYHYDNLLTVWPTRESGDRAFERLSPAIGMTLFPESDTSFFANASRAFKVPAFEDFSVFSPSYNANPKIGPQISDTVEAGIRGNGAVAWQIAGYQSNIIDEIIYNDTLGSNENVDTIHQGMSLKISYDGHPLKVDFSAVRDRGWITRGTTGSLLEGRLIPNIPDWVAKMRANYTWGEHVKSYLQCRYMGASFPLNDYAGLQKRPAFGVWDTGFSYQTEAWTFQMDLKNVLDTHFYEEVAVNWSGALDVYPASGRAWVGSFTWSF